MTGRWGRGCVRVESLWKSEELDVAVWQERARGAASGAGRPGRLEGMGPAGKVAGREQRRGEVELGERLNCCVLQGGVR